MNWSDKDIDELFREAGESKSYEYKSSYFKDIEAQLPIRKKNSAFWIFNGLGLSFIIGLMAISIPSSELNNSVNLASNRNNDNFIHNELESSTWMQSSNMNTVDSGSEDLDEEIANAEALANRRAVQKNQLITPVLTLPLQNFTFPVTTTIIPEEVVNSASEPTDNIVLHQAEELPNDLPTVNLLSRAHQIPSIKTKQARSRVYVEVGGSLGQSLIQNDGKSSAHSIGYELEAGYQFGRKNLRVSAGLGVNQTFYSNLTISERSTVYGFGVKTFDNHYDFKSLLQLTIPVEVSYRLKQHEFTAGATANLPLLATFHHTQVSNSEIENNSNGFTMASPLFKKVVPSVSLGYRYNFGNNWSAAAQVNAQLINPINSDRFVGESSKLPLNLQLTIRKSFPIK